MTYSLFVLLGILLPTASILGGCSSLVINRYSTKSPDKNLGLTLFVSISLTLCASVIVLAVMFLSPFTLLLPYVGPPTLICVMIFSMIGSRKEKGTSE